MRVNAAFLLAFAWSLFPGVSAEAQVPSVGSTTTVSVQCSFDWSAHAPGFDCASYCGAMSGASSLGKTTSAAASSMSTNMMLAQGFASLATGLASYFQDRANKKIAEQRRIEEAVRQEERKRAEEFSKEKNETLAQMKGLKADEVTIKKMGDFGRERDTALQTAIANVRRTLGSFFDRYERDFDSPDNSDCLDRCATVGDTLEGHKTDTGCVAACLTGGSAGDPADSAAQRLAQIAQFESQDVIYFKDQDELPVVGQLLVDVPRPLEIDYATTGWTAAEPVARVGPSTLENMSTLLHDWAWEWMKGKVTDTLGSMIPGGATLQDFGASYGEPTVRNWANVLGGLPQAAADAARLEDTSAAALASKVEGMATGYTDTANKKVADAVGSIYAPIEDKAKEFTQSKLDEILPHFEWSIDDPAAGTQIANHSGLLDDRSRSHVDDYRVPQLWRRR